jgi:single stranded DNA-binding protein (ssb)
MSGLNKVTLIGNLGREPEMRFTSEGIPVTDFSLAVSDGSKLETLWFRVSCWRNLAEIVNAHLKKGSQVYVEGRLHPKQFEGKDGKSHSALDVVAEKVVFLGHKSELVFLEKKAEVVSENGDSAVSEATPEAALDSNGDGLPIQPKAEAGGVGVVAL